MYFSFFCCPIAKNRTAADSKTVLRVCDCLHLFILCGLINRDEKCTVKMTHLSPLLKLFVIFKAKLFWLPVMSNRTRCYGKCALYLIACLYFQQTRKDISIHSSAVSDHLANSPRFCFCFFFPLMFGEKTHLITCKTLYVQHLPFNFCGTGVWRWERSVWSGEKQLPYAPGNQVNECDVLGL